MRIEKRALVVWLVGPLIAVAAASWLAWAFSGRAAMDTLETRGDAALRLRAETLSGWLARYQPLASIYAQDTGVVSFVKRAPGAPGNAEMNQRLKDWNRLAGSADTYLLNVEGRALAASNWDKSWSFVGNDYSFRPYYRQAMEDRLGRYFALGTSSGKRGYYFSYPVRHGSEILGVMVVKVAVDQMEQDLRISEDEAFVTNKDGVIVLSGRPEWRLKSLGSLAASARETIAEQRQFNLESLTPVAFDGVTPSERVLNRFMEVSPNPSARTRQEMLHLARPMAVKGWTLHILTPTKDARAEALFAAALAGAVALVGVLSLIITLQHRNRLLDLVRERERARERLERAVHERTADLRETNARLGQEVEERRTAEARLRSTQSELIQAGKLAALGQMSMSLSHEFNQPLAAIRAYAENAAAFQNLGRADDVADNLGRISKLTERMAELSRNLTSFARKPKQGIEPINLSGVLEQSIELLQGRLQRLGVELELSCPKGLMVMGGATRLQQVFINVIGNAIDACSATAEAPEIDVSVKTHDEGVEIVISDNGPGVPAKLQDQIFDPFFTTKEAGQGLGLGLSISFNIVRDFGGSIDVGQTTGGGARFRIVLKAAPAMEGAL
ncbi:MAG: GHKL domain-containing protein [Rhodobacteraceae bacterium]|nr:GHKL domain-containing protein [Paracoccaceae bacterium]